MSQLIETAFIPGRTLYVVIHAGGLVWNTGTVAFEAYNSAHWTNYAVALTEQTGSGYYSATYPAAIPAGTLSTEVLYMQGGATPTLPSTSGGDTYLTVMQSQGANVQNIAGDGTAPINMAAAADLIISSGTIVAGTISTSSFPTDLTNSHAQAYVGRVIGFLTGACAGQETNITAYAVSGGVLTVTALTNAPAPGDVFVML